MSVNAILVIVVGLLILLGLAKAGPERSRGSTAPAVRPDKNFTISLRTSFDGKDPAELGARLAAYRDAGADHIMVRPAGRYRPALTAKVHFLFVEEKAARADHLQALIAQRALPANFSVIVEGGVSFEDAFERRYNSFVRNGRLIPTFAFIDPFGWTGAPFSLVKKILSHKNCEVFINFMYEEINRFIGHPDQVRNFDSFFGTDDWKACSQEMDPRRRNRCLHDLYLNQLNQTARFGRSFEMSNARDVTDYFLFYATSELLGLKKMKEAMWKVDESGEFRFSDATDPNQFVLFEKAPDLLTLQKHIRAACGGRDVRVGDIEMSVVVDTAFRETHYKTILKSLEKDGHLSVVRAANGRRVGTFPDPDMVVHIKRET